MAMAPTQHATTPHRGARYIYTLPSYYGNGPYTTCDHSAPRCALYIHATFLLWQWPLHNMRPLRTEVRAIYTRYLPNMAMAPTQHATTPHRGARYIYTLPS